MAKLVGPAKLASSVEVVELLRTSQGRLVLGGTSNARPVTELAPSLGGEATLAGGDLPVVDVVATTEVPLAALGDEPCKAEAGRATSAAEA